MRFTLEIDDELLTEAMAATGLSTAEAVVEEALRTIVLSYRRRNAIANLAGLGWHASSEQMRDEEPDPQI
jgi:Arc/MetJ family transcription regulator